MQQYGTPLNPFADPIQYSKQRVTLWMMFPTLWISLASEHYPLYYSWCQEGGKKMCESPEARKVPRKARHRSWWRPRGRAIPCRAKFQPHACECPSLRGCSGRRLIIRQAGEPQPGKQCPGRMLTYNNSNKPWIVNQLVYISREEERNKRFESR